MEAPREHRRTGVANTQRRSSHTTGKHAAPKPQRHRTHSYRSQATTDLHWRRSTGEHRAPTNTASHKLEGAATANDTLGRRLLASSLHRLTTEDQQRGLQTTHSERKTPHPPPPTETEIDTHRRHSQKKQSETLEQTNTTPNNRSGRQRSCIQTLVLFIITVSYTLLSTGQALQIHKTNPKAHLPYTPPLYAHALQRQSEQTPPQVPQEPPKALHRQPKQPPPQVSQAPPDDAATWSGKIPRGNYHTHRSPLAPYRINNTSTNHTSPSVPVPVTTPQRYHKTLTPKSPYYSTSQPPSLHIHTADTQNDIWYHRRPHTKHHPHKDHTATKAHTEILTQSHCRTSALQSLPYQHDSPQIGAPHTSRTTHKPNTKPIHTTTQPKAKLRHPHTTQTHTSAMQPHPQTKQTTHPKPKTPPIPNTLPAPCARTLHRQRKQPPPKSTQDSSKDAEIRSDTDPRERRITNRALSTLYQIRHTSRTSSTSTHQTPGAHTITTQKRTRNISHTAGPQKWVISPKTLPPSPQQPDQHNRYPAATTGPPILHTKPIQENPHSLPTTRPAETTPMTHPHLPKKPPKQRKQHTSRNLTLSRRQSHLNILKKHPKKGGQHTQHYSAQLQLQARISKNTHTTHNHQKLANTTNTNSQHTTQTPCTTGQNTHTYPQFNIRTHLHKPPSTKKHNNHLSHHSHIPQHTLSYIISPSPTQNTPPLSAPIPLHLPAHSNLPNHPRTLPSPPFDHDCKRQIEDEDRHRQLHTSYSRRRRPHSQAHRPPTDRRHHQTRHHDTKTRKQQRHLGTTETDTDPAELHRARVSQTGHNNLVHIQRPPTPATTTPTTNTIRPTSTHGNNHSDSKVRHTPLSHTLSKVESIPTAPPWSQTAIEHQKHTRLPPSTSHTLIPLRLPGTDAHTPDQLRTPKVDHDSDGQPPDTTPARDTQPPPNADQHHNHKDRHPTTKQTRDTRDRYERAVTTTTNPHQPYTERNSHHQAHMEQPNYQASTLMDQYSEFRQQALLKPSTSHESQPPQRDFGTDEDLDMDAQLENVSPERGGSSLQVSLGEDSIQVAQETPWRSIQIGESTPPTLPYRNPRTENASESQNTKRRKAADYSATSTPTLPSKSKPPLTHPRSKRLTSLGIDMIGQIWPGFHMQEALLTQKGKKELHENRTDEEFKATGTPTTEIYEFRTLRRAFPRTKQILYPVERPDAVPGQHLHFTQIPMYERTSQDTGLTEGFHITIRFDGDYKKLSRKEVKSACMERLKLMGIPLGSIYSNPIDIGINTVTRNWAGFIKIHLQNPKRDGLALLRGERAFVMSMGDGEQVIGKVEKGFELITKAKNMRVHLKGDSLRNNKAIDILRTLMSEAYYEGREIEILSLTKPDEEKDFAFITLTTEEAREDVLNNGLTYRSERLKVSTPKDKDMGNSSELRISTTLVANNLPQRESQSTITQALKRLFGEDNISGITFGHTSNQADDRQAGWCHIQCLNAAVYTKWLRRSTYILGRRVDFIPHKGSMDGTTPNPMAIRLAHVPIREAIAQQVQAMSNTAASSPLVSEKFFTKTIKELVETVDGKLTTLTNNINLNTDKRVEASTDTLKTHATHIHNIMSAMAMEFQQSNNRIHNIMQTLAATSPEPPHGNIARLPQAPSTSNAHQLTPPGFHHRSPSSSTHKDQQYLNE